MLEKDFQVELKAQLKQRFPGCLVLKQDPNSLQGIPDLLVLYQSSWASLETKKGPKSRRRPNQEYYIERLNDMSFAAFVDPDNMDEVLNDLEHAFRPEG